MWARGSATCSSPRSRSSGSSRSRETAFFPPPGLARRGVSLFRGALRLIYRVLAGAGGLAHALFVGFVGLGGFLVWGWGGVVWAHVPAAGWGAGVGCGGGGGPLT